MSAMDLPTSITLDYVRQALRISDRAHPLRLLEVGCGAGHLAAALVADGHRVVAIDSSAEAIAAARERGVDARVARFPDFSDAERFDAVLFTRSLHHIPELHAAVDAAKELLREGGALVADDFAHNRVDKVTADWAFGYLKVLRALDLMWTDAWDEAVDPLAAWQAKHNEQHALHTDTAMLEAVSRRLSLGPVERVEYFYRYVCRYLDAHVLGQAAAEAMRWAELALVRDRIIQPIGLRFTARAG
jgi:SAM-dependent methyltransferase